MWVVAANSAGGMSVARDAIDPPQPEWDWVIDDARVRAAGQVTWPTQLPVASGMFDHDWRYSSALAVPGDEGVRSTLHRIEWRRDAVRVDTGVLEGYVGHYQLPNGRVGEIRRDGAHLIAMSQGQEDELIAQSPGNFYSPRFGAWITFERDTAGKVTGFTAVQGADYQAKKLD